ncbi:DUF447 domain-containing protein [Methylovirgula sp. HY1]|uniref:DUF447 domain-containing protein n=1 Tax=Methylovirgula sp. HY1 TaxID=2822761 RepID=UPI001C5A9EBF|nr:DUF447 domain-containing protein [Methylovirgula sp. HY1]QXX75377.1 hypothetical protein MHY1_02196 [Methylovirgula sp. HY1]
MPMIREAVVTTIDAAGEVHIAPFGLIEEGQYWVIAPFRPSKTLDNLQEVPCAVVNYTDDVRIFAGALTGHRLWPVTPLGHFPVPRLATALAHAELHVDRIEEHPERPRFICRVQRIAQHAPFLGLNRAKAAVLELAILASRLDFLPRDKIEREIDYLKIAIDKTAGPDELEAWGWLMQKIAAFYAAKAQSAAMSKSAR